MFQYKYILSFVIILLAAWIALIFYRVIREKLILKVDFWKSNWKIVLFWFIVAALAIGAWYVLQKYDLLKYFTTAK